MDGQPKPKNVMFKALFFFCLILLAAAGFAATASYNPNSTGSIAWRGVDLDTNYLKYTKTNFQDTTGTATDRNYLSYVDTSSVSQASVGGTVCGSYTLVASCSGTPQGSCSSSYDGAYLCQWISGPNICVTQAPCGAFAGQEFSFNILQSAGSITRFDINIYANSSYSVADLNLFAWNNSTSSFVNISKISLSSTKQSLTGSITSNPSNYLSADNNFLILAVYQAPSGDSLYIDYSNVVVTYSAVTQPPDVNLISFSTDQNYFARGGSTFMIDFNVLDPDTNTNLLSFDFNYNTTPQKGGTVISTGRTISNTPGFTCDSNNYGQIIHCHYPWNVPSLDANYYLIINASDGSNSDWNASNRTVLIDSTGPVAGSNGIYGTWGENQSISLSCTDTGGSGCGTIYYKKDIDYNIDYFYPAAWTTYTEPIVFNEDGNWGLLWYAVDNAGNTSTEENFVLLSGLLNEVYSKKELFSDTNFIGNLKIGMPFTLYYSKISQYSDERLKWNIKKLTEKQGVENLQGVLDMNIYSYKYKINPDEDRVGLLAQEAPVECASYDLFTKLWAVDTTCILYKFISAFQTYNMKRDKRESELEKTLSEQNKLIKSQAKVAREFAGQIDAEINALKTLGQRADSLEK
jgi:hypothetical protein